MHPDYLVRIVQICAFLVALAVFGFIYYSIPPHSRLENQEVFVESLPDPDTEELTTEDPSDNRSGALKSITFLNEAILRKDWETYSKLISTTLIESMIETYQLEITHEEYRVKHIIANQKKKEAGKYGNCIRYRLISEDPVTESEVRLQYEYTYQPAGQEEFSETDFLWAVREEGIWRISFFGRHPVPEIANLRCKEYLDALISGQFDQMVALISPTYLQHMADKLASTVEEYKSDIKLFAGKSINRKENIAYHIVKAQRLRLERIDYTIELKFTKDGIEHAVDEEYVFIFENGIWYAVLPEK